MSDIPDICIWTHRWSEWLPKCAESVAQQTRGNYNLIVVCEPGTCHQNMNRALTRSRSRYTVFLDEDVEILTPGWLDILLADLRDNENLGVVGCSEIKDEYGRGLYKEDPLSVWKLSGHLGGPPGLLDVGWLPAFVMAFDRQRCASLTFDEDIPGAKGMTDVDACLHIRKHGLKVALDTRVMVYHPKRTATERGRNGVPTKEEEIAWFARQRAYMTEKWGDMYAKDETLQLPK